MFRTTAFFYAIVALMLFGGAGDAAADAPLISQNIDDTICATGEFARALSDASDAISETDTEIAVRQWVHETFNDADLLRRVLACPEIASAPENVPIAFMPIKYAFPSGRIITVNYQATPLALDRRLALAEKRDLPTAGEDAGPRIDMSAVWTNTDPAWYGIMVVEHGALDQFVGPDKNNTISLKYIRDNIDRLFPQNANCTAKSAWSRNGTAINRVMHQTVNMENDRNDYYVAGDVNLEWVSYAEIAGDVALTVLTTGGWAVISGATKSTRAVRVLGRLKNTMKTLSRTDKVQSYIRVGQRVENLGRIAELEKMRDVRRYTQALRDMERTTNTAQLARLREQIAALEKTDNVRELMQLRRFDAADAARITQRIGELKRNADVAEYARLVDSVDNIRDAEQLAAARRRIAELEQIDNVREFSALRELDGVGDAANDLERLTSAARRLESADDDVRNFKNAADNFRAINQWRRNLRALRPAQRGNIIARGWRALHATHDGAKTISRGARVARAGMTSGRARDLLFQTTLANMGVVARVGESASFLRGLLKFAGDMYDHTTASTGDYTSGVDFSPLLLLSADDLPDQENVVNYGMWLMWAGDAASAADDDAAYLQAMDFATKFHGDLTEYQNDTTNPCNVDIYVVRPVLRNTGEDNAELFYLVMNDTPWSTAE